jgi:hypothetical protein
MNSCKFTKDQAREFLKQEALNEIKGCKDFTKLQDQTFCVVAKYGLQLEAKMEGLLSGEEWSDPNCLDLLVKKVELFFDKLII